VLYSAGGKDWLVDRGTFTYNGDWDWRTYFRGTRAHNAVIVDGFGQALAHRVFRWIGVPRQHVEDCVSAPELEYVAGRTNGFRRLAPPVEHARGLLWVKPDYLIVLDFLSSRGRHDYELLWHIAPGHTVSLSETQVAHTQDADGANLWIHAIGTDEITGKVVAGSTDPIQGWHSRLYGVKEPAPTIVYRTGTSGPLLLATLLTTVVAGAAKPDLGLVFEADPRLGSDPVRLHVAGPGFDDRVTMPSLFRRSRHRDSLAQLSLTREFAVGGT
jgi:hypothetical protein